MTDLQRDRLLELLADQTIFGLDAEEKMELEDLKKKFPAWEKDLSLELTAAAIGLSDLDASGELPANLRTKIFSDADDFFTDSKESQKSFSFVPPATAASSSTTTERFDNVVEPEPARPFWQWLGWAVAGAACVALAINLWLTRPKNEVVQNLPAVQTPTPRLSPAQERIQLLTVASDTVKIPLPDAKNAKEILGEMVWSNNLQKGYARFTNLPANDIAKETYQLWIVDEAQNPKTPINAGVFDISAKGEVIIPVDPQIVVKKPAAIAVTKEKPGGVVVSTQERVVALAKI